MAGANQHMTNSTKDMTDLVDVSDLNLTIGHPNGTLAKITHVENLKLNNDVILFNVLVILKYTDLRKGRAPGTGSEIGGLYLFDKEYNKSAVSNNRSLNLTNVDHNGPCEVCHKAKQTMESFPLSENKSIIFGQLNVWGPYKVSETKAKPSPSPYDDEEGPSGKDGSVHQPDTDFENQVGHNDHHTATPIGFLLRRLRSDAVVKSLTLSLERSRRRHIMPATPSPRYLAPGSGDLFLDTVFLWFHERAKSKLLYLNLYRSIAAATCEVMWIVKIIKNLNVNNLIPDDLYYDNKSAIQIAANLVIHEITKHFDIDVHLVREKLHQV
ncbi:ribonuclease H-like domain-containing protein [Tanacetum coccineum]